VLVRPANPLFHHNQVPFRAPLCAGVRVSIFDMKET
jgi:hypothetical protein